MLKSKRSKKKIEIKFLKRPLNAGIKAQ